MSTPLLEWLPCALYALLDEFKDQISLGLASAIYRRGESRFGDIGKTHVRPVLCQNCEGDNISSAYYEDHKDHYSPFGIRARLRLTSMLLYHTIRDDSQNIRRIRGRLHFFATTWQATRTRRTYLSCTSMGLCSVSASRIYNYPCCYDNIALLGFDPFLELILFPFYSVYFLSAVFHLRFFSFPTSLKSILIIY